MNKITRLISLTERCTNEFRTNEFAEIGLGPAYNMYIFYLCKNPGVPQDTLSKVLHINKSNVTRAIQKLIEDGFLYKEIDQDDKRISRIYATQKAYEIRPILSEKMSNWNEIIMAGLTEEERDKLYELLKKVTINACDYSSKKYMEVDN